ncbi:helix-turn-helix domain-containing protein [Atlantibacter hermannii]|uniref:helix-turn-helix domain-containing protein n=1 Tax=Atlantibacter hermannii TaxID=565 RepID=UPI0028A75662|nr:helix-turn-helix domain-containing protein [Atlantibacter hermannii]
MKSHNEVESQIKEENTSAGSLNWHRADILAAIRKQGSSMAKLSRDNGLHERTLYNVLERSWPRGELIIANFLGLDPKVIWPERYKNKE